MAQFYFLSVLFNVIAGLVLVYGKNLTEQEEGVKVVKTRSKKDKEDSKAERKTVQVPVFENVTFRLIMGVLCSFVGIMKFLTVYRNDIPVIGDLIPAVCGLAGGASILLEYYLVTTVDGSALPETVHKIFIDSRKYIGIACLAAGLLHFIFPQVMLL